MENTDLNVMYQEHAKQVYGFLYKMCQDADLSEDLMQDTFFELLQETNRKGTTCFLSSHVLSEVKKYCRNAAFIKNGKILTVDSIENLTKSSFRQVRVWSNGKEERFSHEGNIQELLSKLQNMTVEDVLIEEPSLEEIFMHYYEEVPAHGNLEA